MCFFQELVVSENKRNRVRGSNKQVRKKTDMKSDRVPVSSAVHICLCLQASSVVKEKRDGALQKVRELIHSSPSILDSKGQCDVQYQTGEFDKTRT